MLLTCDASGAVDVRELGRNLPALAPSFSRRGTDARHRRDETSDPLLQIAPRDYVERLSGLTAGRDRKVRCPFHDDDTPSLHVFEEPERGWFCFGCERGGSIYDFAGLLWGRDLRGAGFVRLQRDLQATLLRGAGRRSAADRSSLSTTRL
jgi:hypothetical protein